MSTKICPHCESEIQAEAKKCRYCKERLDWAKNNVDSKITEEIKNTIISHKEDNHQDKPLLAIIVWWWLLLFIAILLVISYINDWKDYWMKYNSSNNVSICNELQKERFLGLPVGEMKHQLSSIFGMRDISEKFYTENDLYHGTFITSDGGFTSSEKQRVSTLIQQLWLTSNSGIKLRITIKKVKRNGTSWIIYQIVDGVKNSTLVQQATQSFINDVADQYNQGWAYEINIENDGTLASDNKIKQEKISRAYTAALQWNYSDGTTFKKETFTKYKKRWCFDLSQYLNNAYNNTIFD